MTRRPVRRTVRMSEAAMDPSTASLAYQAMAPMWKQIDTVIGGTATMRAAGQDVLPQHEGEGDKRYKERVAVSVLTNYTSLTLDYWVGKPFGKPVQITKDTAPEIIEFSDDVDSCGNDITVVCKDWFYKGLKDQIAYCLVSYPSLPPELQGKTVTKADEEKYGLRPYWCIMPACSVLSVRKQMRNGMEAVMHLRHYDNTVEYIGFEEVLVFQIKEYNRYIPQPNADGTPSDSPDFVVITDWRRDPETKKWAKVAEYQQSQPDIPLVEFNTGKMELEDLSFLNILHYQSASDQRNCLTVARFPILAGSGVDKKTSITIGPYEYLASAEVNSKFYYVEHTGAALQSGQDDLDGLVADMALYGAEMLKQRPDRQTATAAVLDTAQTTAPLQVHVHSFASAVNMALYYTKLWMGLPEGTVAVAVVNTDFALTNEQSTQVDNLYKARSSGAISNKQLINGLIELKALPAGFNAQENEKELDEEARKELDKTVETAKAVAAAQPKPAPASKPAPKPKD